MSVKAVEGAGDTSLQDYLDFLYEGLEGIVCTATKKVITDDQGKAKVDFHRQGFNWPHQRGELIDWILANSPSVDVYLAPAIFTDASGKKEFFKASNVAWSEFDGRLPLSSEMGSIPEPTLRVRSSSLANEHWYWKFDLPIEDSKTLDGINRALTYQLGADSSGWDANQILRPPTTTNHKYATPFIVTVVGQITDTFVPTSLDVLPAYDVTELDEIEASQVPDVQEVIFKYEWPSEVSAFFRSKVEAEADRSAMLMRLGYYLAEMGLSDVEMFSVLRNADDRWGKFKDRTDRVRRLSDLIARARVKYPLEFLIDEDTIPLFGVMTLLQTEVEISWIIEGLLQERGYMLLTGPSGVGKTQFTLRMCIALALGRDFLEFKVERPCRILFWSLEMAHADIKYFVSTMCAGMGDDDLMMLEQNLIIAPIGESYYLNEKEKQQQFIDIVKTCNVDGVVIDSTGSSTSGGVSDENIVKSLMDFNDRIRNELNLFTWYIHHNRKAQGDNKKPNKLADVYGNQYLVNRATSVYCLWPNGKNIEVIPLKKRLAPTEDPWMITRHGNLDFRKATGVHILNKTETTALNLESEDEETTGFGEI